MASVVYLDTHVLVWLSQGTPAKLSKKAQRLVNHEDLRISPFVTLELTFLYEIGRLTMSPSAYLPQVMSDLGLRVCDTGTEELVREAAGMSWTRDPFDRMITAAAAHNDARLVTADEHILANYAKAIW